MIKRICPYCGGNCAVSGGADGNPFHCGHPEYSVCKACGRKVVLTEVLPLPEDDLADADSLTAKEDKP